MDIETFLGGLATAWRLAQTHEDVTTAIIGGALLLIGSYLLKRADKRDGTAHRKLRAWVGIAIMIFSSEGMWEIATGPLGLAQYFALLVFFVGDAAILVEIMSAERARPGSLQQQHHIRSARRYAFAIGFVVVWASDSLVEIPLRFYLPVLAVALWKGGLPVLNADEEAERDDTRMTWMVMPWIRQRIIAIGLAQPGAASRDEIDRGVLIDRLTRLRFKLWQATADGRTKLVTQLTARWHRLTLDADDAMLAEVAERVQRTLVAEARTRPLSAAQVDQLAAAEQAQAAAVAAAEEAERRLDATVADLARQLDEALAAVERQRQEQAAAAAEHQRQADRQQQAIAAAIAAAEEAERQRQADARQAAEHVAGLRRQIDRQQRAVAAAEEARRQDAAAAQRLVAELRQAAEAADADRREAVAAAERLTGRQETTWRRLLDEARGETAARGAEIDQLRAELAEARTRPARRTSAEETAGRVAEYRAEHPDATQQETAAALGLGVRTVRTYWSAAELAEAAR